MTSTMSIIVMLIMTMAVAMTLFITEIMALTRTV